MENPDEEPIIRSMKSNFSLGGALYTDVPGLAAIVGH